MNENTEDPTIKTEFKENPLKISKQAQRSHFLNGVPSSQVVLSQFEQRIQAIFRQFRLNTFTFHLFIMNCIMWLVENLYYYVKVHEWQCVEFFFFAKYQPAISYDLEFWRVILSSFMFRGWLMFFFNNFALNMLGYCIEKQSRFKMVFTFYAGILGGHLLSCCFMNADTLTTGTSCGTIALLPLQICRFIKLKKQNPLQAKKRQRFLIINISSNFILNILAVFGMDPVDWMSHIGCIISGILCMFFFENLSGLVSTEEKVFKSKVKRGKCIRITAICSLFVYIILMWIYILWKLPNSGHGGAELKQIVSKCHLI